MSGYCNEKPERLFLFSIIVRLLAHFLCCMSKPCRRLDPRLSSENENEQVMRHFSNPPSISLHSA